MRKTLSFALLHFSIAFLVGWLLSGDPLVGGAIALVEPAVNTLAYHVHERAWARRGQRAARLGPTASVHL